MAEKEIDAGALLKKMTLEEKASLMLLLLEHSGAPALGVPAMTLTDGHTGTPWSCFD